MSRKHTLIALIAVAFGIAGFTGAGMAVGYMMHMQNNWVAQTTVSHQKIATKPTQPQFPKSAQTCSS